MSPCTRPLSQAGTYWNLLGHCGQKDHIDPTSQGEESVSYEPGGYSGSNCNDTARVSLYC